MSLYPIFSFEFSAITQTLPNKPPFNRVPLQLFQKKATSEGGQNADNLSEKQTNIQEQEVTKEEMATVSGEMGSYFCYDKSNITYVRCVTL